MISCALCITEGHKSMWNNFTNISVHSLFSWQTFYSLVPIRRHSSINQHISFIWPCTFSNIWGVTINWINTQFWSTSRGTFDRINLALIAYTFVGVSFNWTMTCSMPWYMPNWNMSSRLNQRVSKLVFQFFVSTLTTHKKAPF